MNELYFTYKIKYTNSKHYIEYYFYLKDLQEGLQEGLDLSKELDSLDELNIA
jgi:hypothetical protein